MFLGADRYDSNGSFNPPQSHEAFMRKMITAVLLTACAASPALAQTHAGIRVPIDDYRLPNGLRVVLSEDHSAPTVTVGVYYDIGFRIEPRDRTGFAHLFEHMMFQGSKNLGKNE